MTVSTSWQRRPTSCRVTVYDRALRPECFEIQEQRRSRHGSVIFEAWVLRGGHVVRFDSGGCSISEVVGPAMKGASGGGVVKSFMATGEHEAQHRLGPASYLTSVQTETLPEGLYLSSFEELLEFGRSERALLHQWRSRDGPCLSLVDVQHYVGQSHVQSYHLCACGGLILRTQTIFERAGR